jgi:acyl-CoA synthetase (AMP-forming)/AMP-acid ligase II
MMITVASRRAGTATAAARGLASLASAAAPPAPAVTWEGNVAHSAFDSELPLPPYAARFTETVMRDFASHGDRVAVLDGISGEARTFDDLSRDVEGVARGLSGLGVGAGDTVGLFTPNHVDFFAAFHGAAKLGATVTPLNPLYTSHEIAQQLQGSRAKCLVAHSACFDTARTACADLPLMERLVQMDGERPLEGADATLHALKRTEGADLPATPVASDATACLPYSSGTTGLPKGTMLTHDNLVVNLLQCDYVDGRFWEAGKDVIISPLPFFHIYGFMYSVHIAAHNGCTLVTMPRFDMEVFCQLVETHKATRAHLVPPITLGLAKSPLVDQYDLSSLKMITSAAAPLGAEIETAARDRLGHGVSIKQAWGMSELSPLGTCVPDDALKNNSGTVGPPCAHTSIKVVDLETGEALPQGEEGEFCVKGPQVMQGYLDLPDKTRECLTEDGWLMTGDIAKIDADGYVYITDRLKELIKYKGFQVAPAELEEVLCSHPGVADATVIPVEDDEAGELPRAYVVRKTDDVTEDSVSAFVAERVAPHKKLRGGVVFIDAIPKTASGKILRREVVAMDRGE